MILPCLRIIETDYMGRGVFTTEPIKEGTIVEQSPVLVLPPEARVFLDQTLLHDYIFEWGDNRRQVAVALGYLSIYNHSYSANCEYEMNFELQQMKVTTVRDIAEGEQLFVNYNGDWDNDHPLWFSAK